ncbi:MAG: ribose-5-phosphate isomerase RpiA [Ignavibacteria bacterium]|jgi:ribose 5-phosphate isomerase A
MNTDLLKKAAAEKAVEYIKDGMIVGLGTGSTAYHAIVKIAELMKTNSLRNILCIPSSNSTEEMAKGFGIPLTSFDEYQSIDLTIDGADEVDEQLNLIKGGGGALLREKILVQASKKFIVIVDESKLSKRLGMSFFLPVEVFPFAEKPEKKFLEKLGAKVKKRKNNSHCFYTDQNNIILDCKFELIENPYELGAVLDSRAGIAGHGLFNGIADLVVSAGFGKDGTAVVQLRPKENFEIRP